MKPAVLETLICRHLIKICCFLVIALLHSGNLPAQSNITKASPVFGQKGTISTVNVLGFPAVSLDSNSFQRTDFPTTSPTREIKTLDMDGDGKPEIITGEGNGSGLIYRNTGGMSFTLTAAIPGNILNTLVDIDGDGKPDVAATTLSGLSVSINSGTPGNISFGTAQLFPISTDFISRVASADMDGDGKPDIVIIHNANPGRVSILRNTSTAGTVSFDPELNFTVGAGLRCVTITDLDGDGKQDLVVPNASDYFTSVFRNSSTPGTISLDTRLDFYSAGGGPVSVAAGDLDGDGKPEFVETNYNDDNITVFKNKCSPGNLAFDTVSYTTGDNPASVSIGDLDGDGRPDIAVANESIYRAPDNSVSIFKNISVNGNLKLRPKTDFKTINNPSGLFISDLDANGLYEIAVASSSISAFTVLKYQPSSNPPPQILSFTPALAKAGDTIRIYGINFKNITSVNLGGVPVSGFSVPDSTSIVAVVGNGSSGSVKVSGALGTDSADGFVYNAQPVISSFSPSTASAGSVITITGKNLFYTSSVSFGGLPALSFIVKSDSVVLATVGYGATGNIDLTTPLGGTSIAGFNFFIKPPPVVQSFAPTLGSPGMTILIHGKNLINAQAVYFGGFRPDSFTVLSDSVISATIGYVGSGWVSVYTPTGADSAAGFSFSLAGNPVQITSFSPQSAAQGDAVTIHGKNFTGVNAVSFGRVNAAFFTVLSDSVIEAVVFTGASGFVKVSSGGYSDSLAGFTFIPGSSSSGFTLTQFTGSLHGTDALIQWQTSNEAGVDHYILTKSPDSTGFVPVETVVSSRSSGITDYSYTDRFLLDNNNYYQLEIVDTLGNITYSTMFLIINSTTPVPTVKVHPNPASGSTLIDHPVSQSVGQITLMDLQGRVISKTPVEPNTGQTRVDLPVKAPGVYKIVWSDGTKIKGQTVLIR